MKISDIKCIEVKKENIIFTEKTRLWCQLPYPNHPKGCPNYDKNILCPPNATYMDYLVIDYSYFYLVYALFKLKAQRERMLLLHPNWSERQANCVLYWQTSVKKILKERIQEIISNNQKKKIYVLSCGSGFKFRDLNQKKVYSMEAVGINVLKTLENAGINYEIKPKNNVVLTTMLCSQEALSI